MGISERKKREKALRQESIIDAAEKLILRKGFGSATMEDIAKEAELSKGTLYLYFRNKTALFLAISERGAAQLNRRFRQVCEMDCSGAAKVRLLGESYILFVKENPVYFQAFSHYESIRDQEFLSKNRFAQRCEDHARESLEIISAVLRAGMEDGSIDNRYNPEQLAILIWASARGIVQMVHLQGSGHPFRVFDDFDLNVESLIHSFLQLIETGLKRTEGDGVS